MMFSRRTAQLLHEDHRATIEVIEGLDDLLARARRKAPDVTDAQVQKVLEAASGTIQEEIDGHFAFEENELFTRLEEMGDVAIGEHLRGEHAALLPLGRQVAEMARAALGEGFSAQSWGQFRALAGELIERMLMHIQKEEMALLPALDDLLDDDEDMALSTLYASTH